MTGSRASPGGPRRAAPGLVTTAVAVGVLVLAAVPTLAAPATPTLVVRAPYVGTESNTTSTTVSGCHARASNPVAPGFNFTTGTMRLKSRAVSLCAAASARSDAFARSRLIVDLGAWNATSSGSVLGNLTVRLFFHAEVGSTATCSTGSALAFGELEIDAYLSDLTTVTSYYGSTGSGHYGYTNQTTLYAAGAINATYHARVVFTFQGKTTAKHRYGYELIVATTASTTSCGASRSVAQVDAAHFGHGVTVASIHHP